MKFANTYYSLRLFTLQKQAWLIYLSNLNSDWQCLSRADVRDQSRDLIHVNNGLLLLHYRPHAISYSDIHKLMINIP